MGPVSKVCSYLIKALWYNLLSLCSPQAKDHDFSVKGKENNASGGTEPKFNLSQYFCDHGESLYSMASIIFMIAFDNDA